MKQDNTIYIYAIVALIVVIGIMFFSQKKDIFTSSSTSIRDSGNTNVTVEAQKSNEYDMYSAIATSAGKVITGVLRFIPRKF